MSKYLVINIKNHCFNTCLSSFLQELAKLLENQHGYIDLQNIPENKYYSMTQAENEEEKI